MILIDLLIRWMRGVMNMSNRNVKSEIQALITKYGKTEFLKSVNQLELTSYENAMTIVCNSGLHPLPIELARGNVINATSGNIDFTNEESARLQIVEAIQKVYKALHKYRPSRVYLLPWGPAAISCQVKHIVYKTLGLETIDILYLGEGRYIDLDIPSRSIIPD